MIKTLLKKQLLELNQNFFQDKKTGKAKSKSRTILSIVGFAILMIGVLGGMFFMLSMSLQPLISMDMGWLYFLLMSMIALALGIFGSVFNTYASLYKAKDNEMLLSLPIPVSNILVVRLLGVYLMGAMYTLIVYLPAVIVYYLTVPLSLWHVVCPLIFGLLLTIVVLILSCVLGWGVAKASGRLKNKSLVTVVLSLAFLVAYYFVYFRASQMITELLQHAVTTGESIRMRAYPIYVVGRAAAGDGVALLLVSLVVVALFLLTVYVLAHSFLSIATATDVASRKAYRRQSLRRSSVAGALLGKEMRRLLASSVYMLNCALGTLLLPLAGILILWKGQDIITMMTLLTEGNGAMAGVLMIAVICMLVSMNDITAPSISLEGNTLWLMQSLPVTPQQVLQTKIRLHVLLTAIPAVICSVCVCIVLQPDVYTALMIVVLPMLYALFGALFGLTVNLLHPNLTWTSETAVVKQSMSILAVLFGGWLLVLLLGLVYYLLRHQISPQTFLFLCLLVMIAVCVAFYRYLMTEGVKRFVRL